MKLKPFTNFFFRMSKVKVKYIFVVALFFLCSKGYSQETVFLLFADPTDLTASETPIDEGKFQVRLSSPNPFRRDILVTAELSGTAILNSDYSIENISNAGVIRFEPGEFVKEINIVDIVDDTLIEGDETVVLTLRSVNISDYVINPTIDNSVTLIIEDNDACVTIDDAPELDASIPTVFCDVINQDLNEYTQSIAPAGSVLTWSTSSDLLDEDAHLVNTVVQAPGKYNGFFYDAADRCAGPPLSVELQIFETPTVESTTGMQTCGASEFTLAATVSDGGTLNWYDSEVGGTLLETGTTFMTPVLSTTTTYYVDATANGCTSERVAVEATVNIQPSIGTITDTMVCSITRNGRETTVDLDTTLSGADDGVWIITTDPSGSVVIGTDNVVDFEGLTSGDYVFTYTTTVALAPCTNESGVLTINVSSCTVDSDSDGVNDDDEQDIGTLVNNPDTDGDGINDGDEIGDNVADPIDTDSDGVIDALESNILDADGDMVVDQLDPANTDPCNPNPSAGVCDTDGDGITDGDEIANDTDPLDACDPNLTPACMPGDIDLQVEKTADKLEVNVEDELVFTITLTNLSADRIIDVEVGDLLEPPFNYVSHESSIGDYDALTGLWTIDEILANEEHTLTISVTIGAISEGDYENTVVVLANFPDDSDLTNNEDTVTITVNSRSNNDCGFLFNQFSPNSDGTNDLLRINCIENYPDNTLEVYDRYGNIVYEAKGYDNTWGGTGKNGDLPKGTYFYILNLGDGSDVTKGWIQIIR